MPFDASGTALVPTKPRYLPAKILRAIDRVLELDGLNSGVRTTLQTICKYVQQANPLGPVYTRRSKIAARAGLSERSVARHLGTLAARGLLRVEQQRHGQRDGAFLVTHIFLTEKLARLVGLLDAETPALPAPPSATLSDAANKGGTLPSFSSNRQPSAAPATGIPADLAWLAPRMSRWGIFGLMKTATRHGQRLADIVAVAQARLDALGLAGRRLYAYLAKLASGARCYRLDAERLRQQQAEAAQGRAAAAQAAALRARWAGRTLASRDGRTTVTLAADGLSAQVRIPGRSDATMPLCTDAQLAPLVEALARGQLREAGERMPDAA